MALDIARIAAFVGGACAVALWQSGGLLASFVGHLALVMTMVARSGLAGAG